MANLGSFGFTTNSVVAITECNMLGEPVSVTKKYTGLNGHRAIKHEAGFGWNDVTLETPNQMVLLNPGLKSILYVERLA